MALANNYFGLRTAWDVEAPALTVPAVPELGFTGVTAGKDDGRMAASPAAAAPPTATLAK